MPILRAAFACLAVLVLAGPAPVRAQDAPSTDVVEVAEGLYERGVDLFQGGEYARAAVLFEEAWRNDPTAALAYNAGRAWDRAGEVDAAIDWYTRAAQGGDEVINARVAEALANLGQAAPHARDHHAGARPGRGRRVAGAALVGVGVGAVTLGAVWAGRAHDRHDAAQTATTDAQFARLVREGRSARSASNAAWATGLVAAGVGTTLVVLRGDRETAVTVSGGPRAASVGVRF